MSESLAQLVIDEARRLGFHRVGITPVQAPLRYQAYRDWVAADMHGSMAYMATPENAEARADLDRVAAGARTVVVVALAYDPDRGADAIRADASAGPRGFVARYARGADYHGVMKQRLYALAETVAAHGERPVLARPCVDTAPVLERDFAEAAGIGFVAKNTMVIAPGLGSYVLLGELLLDVELPATGGRPSPRCGACTACLDACPTGAFAGPFVLDARRCISYLTIEHRGDIPRALRPAMGTMIFGCDICQEVCPFNRAAPDRSRPDAALAPRSADRGAPDLHALLTQGANQRRKYVDGTAMRRASRDMLDRNLCVALGNADDPRSIEPLTEVLASHRSPMVRGHAAWALGRLGARAVLRAARAREQDRAVHAEIDAALADLA